MTVYFQPKRIDNLNNYLKATNVPAHQKIGALYSRILESNDQSKIANYLVQLQVYKDDKTAMEAMCSLVQTLADGSLRIIPSDNTGVYFFAKPAEEKFEKIAVFKIGRKRAAIETMARQFAHHLSLPKQMVPGMFCAMENLSVYTADNADDQTVEDLWNGNEKVFSLPPEKNVCIIDGTQINIDPSSTIYESPDEKTATAVVGIVQPFLKKEPIASLYDYTLMTIFALALGVRDGKNDNYKGSTFFDVEDCMPIRIDPPWNANQSPSAIDLPYLDKNPRTNQQLSIEEVNDLAILVKQWNISSIINAIKHLKIRYEDSDAEQLDLGKTGVDEGGHHIKIEQEKPHLINGHLNHFNPFNTKSRVLLPEQLDACNTRLQRIRDYIMWRARRGESFSPQDLVYAVDLYGKVYHEAIQSKSSDLPKQDGRILSDSGPNSLSGRRSPKDLRIAVPSLNELPSSPKIIKKLEKVITS
jgi:ssDNA-specific exonuclease RecJ